MVIEGDDLSFCGNDPGAAKFGNFINYYSFHKADERIKSLHESMFTKPVDNNSIVCLDIGCNTGELTSEIYNYMKNEIYQKYNVHILGIDIDPTLIERAKDNALNSNISFIKLNIMNLEEREKLKEFLKLHNKNKFDISFCFSVTMWIHLNNGDEKLLQFLEYLKDNSKAIIIEPQPWKCYRNAQRRMKKSGGSFISYEELKYRHDIESVIENTLTSYGLNKVYETSPSQWNRKIQSFHQAHGK